MPAITFARQNSFRCFYLEHIRLGEIIHPYSFMVAVAPRGDIRFLPRRNYIDTALFLRQLYTICNNKLLLLYPQSRSTNHHMFYHHTIPYAISRFKDREDYHNRTLPLRKSKSITICISESSFWFGLIFWDPSAISNPDFRTTPPIFINISKYLVVKRLISGVITNEVVFGHLRMWIPVV